MKADRKERFVELGAELVGIVADVLFKESNVTPITEAKKAETKKADEAPKKETKKADAKPAETKPAETKPAETGKAFTVSNPAREPADVKMFKDQWKALGAKQNDYLDGKIDSLGNAIEGAAEEIEATVDEPATEEYENFDEPASEEVTVEQVRTAFKDLAQAKTSAECTAILKQFKVTKISEIKKEDYAKVVAKAQAAANA